MSSTHQLDNLSLQTGQSQWDQHRSDRRENLLLQDSMGRTLSDESRAELEELLTERRESLEDWQQRNFWLSRSQLDELEQLRQRLR
jgi:uncharacterized protein YbaP (TraB family)